MSTAQGKLPQALCFFAPLYFFFRWFVVQYTVIEILEREGTSCRIRPLPPLLRHRGRAASRWCGCPGRKAMPWPRGCSTRPTRTRTWRRPKATLPCLAPLWKETTPLTRAWPCFSGNPTATPGRTWWSFPATAAVRWPGGWWKPASRQGLPRQLPASIPAARSSTAK